MRGDRGLGYTFRNNNSSSGDMCGAIRFPTPTSMTGAARTAFNAGLYESMMDSVSGVAREFVKEVSLRNLRDRVGSAALVAQVSGLTATTGQEIKIKTTTDKCGLGDGTQYGWMGAGAWFICLTVGTATSATEADQAIAAVIGPQFLRYNEADLLRTPGALEKIKKTYNAAMMRFNLLYGEAQLSGLFGPGGKLGDLGTALSNSFVSNYGRSMINMLFTLIDAALAFKGVWQFGPQLKMGVQVDSSVNPLAAFIAFGIAWVQGCLELIGWGLAMQALGAAANVAGDVTNAVGVLGMPVLGSLIKVGGGMSKALGQLIAFIGTVGLIGGVLVAYLVPLQPFLKFLFNTLTWVLGVFEAVLAVPLIAIAHLNPEGNGLPGQNARQAYFLVLNIFLRPVLMVFGLCFGIVLFSIGVGLLNLFFEVAGGISFSSAAASEFVAFSILTKIMMTVIYLILIYIMANGCWKGIDYLPTQALRWMGQGAVQLEKLGDAQQISQGISTSGTFFGSQLTSNAGQVFSGVEQSGGALAAGVRGVGSGLLGR